MANEEQLAILKQGVEVWNRWRIENRATEVGLSGAGLSGADLTRADLMGADLSGADLNDANLFEADLRQANLRFTDLGAYLSEAELRQADLRAADLGKTVLQGPDLANLTVIRFGAVLDGANLSGADLRGAILCSVNLIGANLSEANLMGVDFSSADLLRSNFSKAWVGSTIFGDSDLSETLGLEEVVHGAPSRISTDTFAISKGKIPEAFLRGCGLSDWEIASVKLYNPDLSNDEVNKILYRMYDLRATQALQISPLFISYSHADSNFVDKIGDNLTYKGIRFWRDIHEMRAGRMEKQIDRAIRQNPTVLLILSENSLKSDWVEHEVRTARQFEKEMGRDVLCPVALDDSWRKSSWSKRVMEQIMEYNILDFSEWSDDSKFEGMFRKLIDGLELFYKG